MRITLSRLLLISLVPDLRRLLLHLLLLFNKLILFFHCLWCPLFHMSESHLFHLVFLWLVSEDPLGLLIRIIPQQIP
uniref:Zinc finger CCCH domain-containing protein 67-like n=1 Tax=Rhizophora mucronata TaxID=61149 RepID=A0A2P2MAX2_RHIMU